MRNKILKFILFNMAVVITASSILNTRINTFAEDKDEEITYEAREEEPQKIGGIGSVSKMFASAAIMQLYDEGKIDLDSPVTEYISDFRMADPRYKDITVRMLLNHTSGIMGTTNSSALMMIGANEADFHDSFLESLSEQSLKADPGAFSAYCNDGFMLLEILVERVSGQTFTDYIKQNISVPLGLTQTGTPIDAFKRDNMEQVFYMGKSFEPEYCGTIGSGGVLSTAEELSTFGSAFFTGNTKLLSEKAKDEMKKSTRTDEYLDNYGLGWDIVSEKEYEDAGVQIVAKGGDCYTQHAGLVVAPDQEISVAVISSGGSGLYNEFLAKQLLDIALSEQGIEIEHPVSMELETVDIVPEEYKKYEGYYVNGNEYTKITFPDMKYMLIQNVGEKGERYYKYTTNNTFVLMEGDITEYDALQDKSQMELSFEELNGKIYTKTSVVFEYENLGSQYYKVYDSEKIEEENMSSEFVDSWKTHEGKYYQVNGKYYNSGFAVGVANEIKVLDDISGYIDCGGRSMKLTGKDSARAFLQVPGSSSRDQLSIDIKNTDGVDYISVVGDNAIYMKEDGMKVLSEESLEVDTESDKVSWFVLGDEIVNRTILLDRTEKTSVYIYDDYDNMIYSSYMKGYGEHIPLPEKGKIAIIGESGEHVSITVE